MQNHTVRVGVVGAGDSAVQTHIPRLSSIDGVEVVSVSNRTRESSQRAARRLGIPTIYDSWTDLVNAGDTNAVFIGTWPYLHMPVTIAALQAGKHVLCQSRMAMNASEAHQMLDASRRRPDLVTALVPTSRLGAGGQTIKRLIADGWLGDLLAIDVVSGSEFVDRASPFFWRLDREVSGVNALEIGMLGESIDRIVGPIASVIAVSKVNVPRRRAGSDPPKVVTVPDHVEIIGEMAIGVPFHMRLSQVTGRAEEGVWFFGSEATLRTDGYAETLFGARRGESAFQRIETPTKDDLVHGIAAEFVAAIRGERPIERVTFEQGVRYMEFTEAVHRSSRIGQMVHLPL